MSTQRWMCGGVSYGGRWCKPEGCLAPSQGSLLGEFRISPSRQLRQQWILQQACAHKTHEEGESLMADGGEGTQKVKGCILTLETNNGAVLCPFFVCFYFETEAC